MQSNNKKKICIVVSSLGKGGAERSSAILSKILAGLGYDIHIVSVLNIVEYDYSGTLLNLGELKDSDDTLLGRLKRFIVFRKYLSSQKFDLIIDSRSRPTIVKEFFIKRILYKGFKAIYLIHSWELTMYLSKSIFFAKSNYRNTKGLIAVSRGIKKKIQDKYGLKNITAIYNSIDIEENNVNSMNSIDFDEDFIMFYGRLDDKVKNLSLLIDAFKMSSLPKQNIKLLILGSGSDLSILKQKSKGYDIIFKPFTNNPFPFIKKSRFVILTSRFEGFPMTLLESLSIGVPVVSVDCNSGPSEIIENGFNGLLVKNNNNKALAQAMDRLVFDKELYDTCVKNSKRSVLKFSVDNITNQWKELIESII